MVQFEYVVAYPDPSSVSGMRWQLEPVQWPSPLAELEAEHNLRLCAAPSSGWLLLHFRKSGSIHVRREFFPEVVDFQLPLAGFVPGASTGMRHVRIYTPPPESRLVDERWEGVSSWGIGVGLPKVNIGGELEVTTGGESSLGLSIEAAVAELELQAGNNWQATLYCEAPTFVTPKVGYGVDVTLPDNRYLIVEQTVAGEYGGAQDYGRKKLGAGYWLIDSVWSEQRNDLYNWWHQTWCDRGWCPMYPEELH